MSNEKLAYGRGFRVTDKGEVYRLDGVKVSKKYNISLSTVYRIKVLNK